MKVYMFIVMFLFIGIFFIVSNENLKLSEKGNVDKLVSLSIGWIGEVFENTKSISGEIINLDWLPKNETE